MMEIWNEKDSNDGIKVWENHGFVNEEVIGQMRLNLDLDDLMTWYPAFLKIEDCLYPVLFRAPIEHRRDIYPTNRYDSYYMPNMGPSIKDNEICMSRQVVEAMIWKGHISTFTMNEGIPQFKSPLDSAQTCRHYNEPIDVEIIPYDFSPSLIKYFDHSKQNCLNSKFNLKRVTGHNSLIESIDEHSPKSIKLDRCYLGETGTAIRLYLEDDISSMLRKESLVYFLSFTSFGVANTIYDRQRHREQKTLQMETPKSIEEAQMEYFDWVKTTKDKDIEISIGDKNPKTAQIVVDKSGVSIDNIDNKKEEKVEESDELLI